MKKTSSHARDPKDNDKLVLTLCCSKPTLFGLVGVIFGMSLVLTLQLCLLQEAGIVASMMTGSGHRGARLLLQNENEWSVLSYTSNNNNGNNSDTFTQPQHSLQVVPESKVQHVRKSNAIDDKKNVATSTTIPAKVSLPQQNWAELYHEAWYIGEEPDWNAFHRIYEDERITELVQQQRDQHDTKKKDYQPYQAIDPQTGESIFFSERARQTAIDSVENDSFGPMLYTNSSNHAILTTLRALDTTVGNFNPVCHRYKFPNISLFPTVSIIIPMQHERAGLLSLTVHSFLGRTPPELLKEIIIVDDNGNEEERDGFVDDEMEIQNLLQLHPTKIKYIRNERRLGCAGSRMAAIRQATGEVMVVMDSHVEMLSSTWLQHLLLPILENPKTYAMQTLDYLDDRSPGYHRRPGNGRQFWSYVDLNFLHSYVGDRFSDNNNNNNNNNNTQDAGRETPPMREPFEIPFAPGSLFAMRIDEFWRLGGYDQGLEVWGGENTELTMKVWRCGLNQNNPSELAGRVMVVPCSRAAHVYRQHVHETGRWPPKVPPDMARNYGLLRKGKWMYHGHRADVFHRLLARNNLRIFRVWMGRDAPTTRHFYRQAFGVGVPSSSSTNTNPEDDLAPEWRRLVQDLDRDPEIARQELIRDQNQCKSYDWFEQHVVYRLVGRRTPLYAGVPTNETLSSSSSSSSTVSCGGHFAMDCGSCPQGQGADWCNGDCHWCPNNAAKEHTQASWTVIRTTTTAKSLEKSFSSPKGDAVPTATTTAEWALSDQSRCVARSMTCRTEMPPPPNELPSVVA
ncbi:hypothetical protein ACA910_001815 [Epithemia clementina (nom. ined.)]